MLQKQPVQASVKIFPESLRAKVHASFDSYLAKLNLRQTRQRKVILDALIDCGAHVDAETVAQHAKKLDKSIGLATVYRALQLMVEAGVLTERNFGKNRSYFEVTDPGHVHHDHLICTSCGEIVEFFNEELEALQEKIASENGFQLNDHRMELYGLCAKASCQAKSKVTQ